MNTIRWQGDVREQFSELETHQLQSNIDNAIGNLNDCNDVTSAESQQAVQVLRKASRPISIRRTIGDYLAQKNFADVFAKLWRVHFSKFTNLTDPLVKDVIFIIRNFTTKSPNLCASMCQCGAISLLLRQLQAPNITVEQLDNEDTLDYVLPLFMIIQSAIHLCGDNRDVYRKAGAIAILSPYVQCLQAKDTELNKRMVKLGALLTLAYILNESETKRLDSADIKLCITFLHLLHAKDANTRKSMSKSGISKVMILDGVNHVALLNDENKVNLVAAGVLVLLTKVLKGSDFSVEEHILAARGLWTLSFADSNREIMKNNVDVIQGLKENSRSPNEDLSSTCNAALWEIYEGDEDALSEIRKSRGTEKAHATDDVSKPGRRPTSILDILGRSLSSPGEDAGNQQSGDVHHHVGSKIKVMISYQWDVQRTMMRVKESLSGTNKFSVWMDVDKMKGSILAAMANAVEESDVILICLSRKYKESLNCRTEASYAYKLKKPLIPLMVEDNYNPDGWLGALVGVELYYDVTQENLPLVIRAIEDKVHVTGDVRSPVHHTPSVPSDNQATKPHSVVSSWSSQRIAQWLDDNDLSDLKDRLHRLKGKHLKQMYDRYRRAPDAFDRALKEDLSLDFITIVIFTTALEELFN